jgi:acylphosphatase
MSQLEIARLHAVVEGRVQGVGFRSFVQDVADALALTGWVRNRYDGCVEVLAEGDRQTLQKLETALYRGPRASYVTNVISEWGDATGEFKHFQIRLTSI